MRLSILAFALGTILMQLQPELPARSLIAGALLGGALLAGLAFRDSPRALLRRLLAIFAGLLLGFGWAALRADLRLADTLPLEWEGRDVEIVGVIADLPQGFSRGERFSFDVEEVRSPHAVVPQRIALSWYRSGPEEDTEIGAAQPQFRAGERWRFVVRLKRPHGNANPSAFDYEAWLLERGIRATGYVRPREAAECLDAFVAAPGYAIERLRQSVRDRFAATLPGAPYAGVLAALAVGDQRAIQGELWNIFSRTGTTHLMSISGLHVTMVAALFGWLVGRLWRRSESLMLRMPAQRAAVLAAWAAAFAYALLSGFSVPAQRTFYMLSAGVLAVLSGRRTTPSQTLALALLSVLLLDPWAALAPGFWLSFGAVAVLFHAAAGLPAAPGWRAALRQWGSTQWAVTVGSLPLLLLFFQQFSLVSPLANAIAIPVVSFVITPLALLVAVLPLPGLLQFDHLLLEWLMRLLEWLAQWPVLTRPAPPMWAVVLGSAGVAWLLLPRGFPARWLGLLLLVPAVLQSPPRPPAGEAQIDVLDVGQGLAVVVRTATHVLLYDAGPLYSAESDAGQRVVVPYLRAIGVDRLDTMIVTHRDTDHAGGAASVLAALRVDHVLSSLPEIDGELCRSGQRWEWDGVRFSILYPFPTDYSDGTARRTNNLSCVLAVEAGERRLLLASDIEARDEQRLLSADAGALRADALLVPHHGSRTSSTPAFVAAVGAGDVIYSVGYRNRFGHPRPDVAARYGDARAWRSDRDGAVGVRLGDGMHIEAWRSSQRRYWHGR